jgi:hypothetical protein
MSFLKLFVNDFDLLIDHLPGKPIDGHVHPVILLAFDNEVFLKAGSIWRVGSTLHNHVKSRVCRGHRTR